MSIKYFNRNLGGFDVAEDFKRKDLHIVCIAVNALTFYNCFAGVAGIDDQLTGESCRRVNISNETGTLWPRAALTILPLSVYNDRDDHGNSDAMRKHIKDAFLAQEKYVKSSEILFAFEGRGDFDYKLALDILKEEAEIFRMRNNTPIYYIPE